MFFNNLREIILTDATRERKSSTAQAVERCDRINWFLYKSDYVLGRRDWRDIGMKNRQDVMDGIIKYVLDIRSREPFMHLTTTVPMRRTRGVI